MTAREYTIYYLSFTSPLHIGSHRPEGYDRVSDLLRSDTMVAAIQATWAKMGHADWIDDYISPSPPPWTVSSAFPFVRDEDGTKHFFPKTLKPMPIEGDVLGHGKKLKKIKWIEKQYFERMLADKEINLDDEVLPYCAGAFLGRDKNEAEFIQKEQLDRVTVSRDGSEDARPFVMERLLFKEDAGLFFLADGDTHRLDQALDLLQYEGLGTDRNIGQGQFNWSKDQISIQVPDDTQHVTNLGLYVPLDVNQNTAHPAEAFSLIKRGGWITSYEGQGLRKSEVYMYEEGSIFQGSEGTMGHHALDITPDIMRDQHHVYRSGHSLFLPIKWSAS